MLKKIVVLLAVLLLVCSQLAGANDVNRTVRIGCFPLNGFFEISKDGKVSGYGAEYTEAVAEHAGWNYTYVPYATWVEALDALAKKEIDILAPSQRTAERNALYAFDSFPIATEYGTLLALDKSPLIYEDYASFQGLKVGVVDTLVFLPAYGEFEKNNGFKADVRYYKDTPALLAALQSGEVEAIIANMMVKTDTMKLLARFGAAPVYYMMPKDETLLQAEMNLAIDRLTSAHPAFQKQLDNTYFSSFINLPFSKKELDYIKTAGELKIACTTDNAPYSYVDAKGVMQGVAPEIFKRIAQLSGLKFTFLPIPAEGNTEQFLDKNTVAITNEASNAAIKQLHNSNITIPYLTLAKYFVGKTGTKFNPEAKLKVAVIATGKEQLSIWQKTYPNFKFNNYPNLQAAIDSLHGSRVDLLLADRYALENVLGAPQNSDLHILPVKAINENVQFRVLYRDSQEHTRLLTSILNKSIQHISTGEKDAFLSDQIQATRYKYGLKDFLYQYRFQLFLLALFMLAGAMGLSIVYQARRKAQELIEENEMKLRHISNNIPGGVIVLKANQSLNITYANDGFLELIGCERNEFDATEGSYLTYVHPEDLDIVNNLIASQKKEASMELRIQKHDKTYVPVLFNCTVGQKSNGEKELYCVVLDMTEQNKLLEQLRVDNKRRELILDRMEEIFYEVDLQSKTITTSPSFYKTLGWELPSSFSLNASDFESMWKMDRESLAKLLASTRGIISEKHPDNIVLQLESLVEKRPIWCEFSQYPILSREGEIISVIGLIKNIDEQVEERAKLMEQALHDPLTGLYNKEAFEAMVEATLTEHSKQNHALVFVDLDHFKAVNDTLGHLVGDQAICEAADKLKVIFSNYDIISRFGGDEFCILVKNIPLTTLQGKMEWLVDKLKADYSRGDKSVHVTCSCGVACTDEVGFEYKVLMDSADKALYKAKESGRNQVVYHREMQ